MRVEVNGVKLFFDVEGAGLVPEGPGMREKPTLLLLHGGPGMDHSLYKPDFSALADVAQVVYLDHRGQGRSDASSPDHWNLDQWADDVRSFCDALGIESPVVFGHSFGGMVAMAYAIRHPEHPGKLIFSGTYARQNLPRILQRFEEVGGIEAREAAKGFWSSPGPDTTPDYAVHAMGFYSRKSFHDLEGLKRIVPTPEVGNFFIDGEIKSFDLLAGLARVRCPTLVLGGAFDPVCPIEDQQEIAAALPAELARFERLEQSSHMFWIDEPERFFALLREFLDS